MNLQNPFVFAASDAAAEQAAALSPSPRSPGAAADPLPASVGGPQESPASDDWNPDDAGDLGCIGEIFAGARKLDGVLDAEYLFDLDPGNQKYRGMLRPRLNVAAFMLELDEAPLFLRQAV